MKIAVYGACICSEEHKKKLYEIFKKIFKDKDIEILVGASIGCLEAVLKAAKDNNIKTEIAVLERYKDTIINELVDRKKIFNDELERMKYTIEQADCFIACDGDLGTYEEVFITWVYIRDNNKKMYIMGRKMQDELTHMIGKEIIARKYKEKLIFVEDEINI